MARIEEIRSKIKAGTPFADLAREASEGITKGGAESSARRERGAGRGARRGHLRQSAAESPGPSDGRFHPPFQRHRPQTRGYKPFYEVKGTAQADLRRAVREAVHGVHGTSPARRFRQDLRSGARQTRREEDLVPGFPAVRTRLALPPRFSFDAVVRSHGWYDLPPFRYDPDGGALTTVFGGGEVSFRARDGVLLATPAGRVPRGGADAVHRDGSAAGAAWA